MDTPDWASAENVLFERSREAIQQFVAEHLEELLAAFVFTVDSEYAGVALNFDTLENSLVEAQRDERSRIAYRNRLFAMDHGWQNARYYVAHPTNRVDASNLHGPVKYPLVTFVALPVWEDYFRGSEECTDEEGLELEGRIIVALWRVTDRLVSCGAFDGFRRSTYFRVAFSFHDDEMVVLRILNWPDIPAAGRLS